MSVREEHIFYSHFRGDFKIPHRRIRERCWEIFCNLFVKCMQQFTKDHLYHLFGVSHYYVMYRQSAQFMF